MKGTYRFYQDGQLIATSENLLTTQGKLAILNYLAGRGGGIGGSVALGIGQTPATVLDTRLTFEVDRATIESISSLPNEYTLIFKTTLPQEREYTINEIGIFSMDTNPITGSMSRLLSTFEEDIDTWDNGSYVTTNAHIGQATLRLQPSANGTLTTTAPGVVDLSYYTANDNFTLAFTKNSANASSITLKFSNINNDYFSLNKSISALGNGFQVVQFRLGDFVPSGSISWAEIASISISHSASAGGASDIYLDGLRIEDDDTDSTEYALVSRSVVSPPVTKTTVSPMDIEYSLQIGFA